MKRGISAGRDGGQLAIDPDESRLKLFRASIMIAFLDPSPQPSHRERGEGSGEATVYNSKSSLKNRASGGAISQISWPMERNLGS